MPFWRAIFSQPPEGSPFPAAGGLSRAPGRWRRPFPKGRRRLWRPSAGPRRGDRAAAAGAAGRLRYLSFSWRADRLDDGRVTPGAHDGMAAFAAPGERAADPQSRDRRRSRRLRCCTGLRPEGQRRRATTSWSSMPSSCMMMGEPVRHDSQLRGRTGSLGRVAHLRGDAARGAGGAPRTTSRSRTATSSKCLSMAAATPEPIVGHGPLRSRSCRRGPRRPESSI